MMTSFVNKTSRESRLQKIQAGVAKHFANVTSVTLGGVEYALADLQALVQSNLDAMSASVKAKAAWRTQVQAERDSRAAVDPVVRLLKAYVVAHFGDGQASGTALEDFGMKPRRMPQASLATKVGATGKAKATRAARHTMGPKQKLEITGETPAPPAKPTV
jgi:hypothetical protein